MSKPRDEFQQWLRDHIGEKITTQRIADEAERIFSTAFSRRVRIDEEDPTMEGVVPDVDVKPLNGDAKKVFNFMAKHEGVYFTPEEISEATGVTERSVTSHIRNFRLPKWGGHDVPKRRRYNKRVWEYVMRPNRDSFTYRHFSKMPKTEMFLARPEYIDCNVQIEIDEFSP